LPRVKKLKKKRKLDFTIYHRQELLTCFDFLGMGFGDDEDARRTAWFRHREELLKFWLQSPKKWLKHNQPDLFNRAPGGPLTRPYGWWKYESVGPRRRIGGKGTPIGPADFWGRPRAYDGDYDMENEPRFESEAAYLKRHGLLTEGELENI